MQEAVGARKLAPSSFEEGYYHESGDPESAPDLRLFPP